MIRKSFVIQIIILTIFLFASSANGQSKSNFQKFNQLIESSLKKIEGFSDGEELYINYSSPRDLIILKDGLKTSLLEKGIKISEDKNSSLQLDYSVSETEIKYNDIFRDGLFGEFLVEREVILYGNYFLKNGTSIIDGEKLYLNSVDTVSYEKINEIENINYRFTIGNKPDEPFFSTLLEPVVAISAVTVAIILFFTVRSK